MLGEKIFRLKCGGRLFVSCHSLGGGNSSPPLSYIYNAHTSPLSVSHSLKSVLTGHCREANNNVLHNMNNNNNNHNMNNNNNNNVVVGGGGVAAVAGGDARLSNGNMYYLAEVEVPSPPPPQQQHGYPIRTHPHVPSRLGHR